MNAFVKSSDLVAVEKTWQRSRVIIRNANDAVRMLGDNRNLFFQVKVAGKRSKNVERAYGAVEFKYILIARRFGANPNDSAVVTFFKRFEE